VKGNRARLAVSLAVFAAVFALHARLKMYPAADPTLSRWAELAPVGFSERLSSYYGSGGLWLGYCYGVAAGFAAFAALSFLAHRTRGLAAAGGLTFSGALAAAACFLTGCCGSPMLAIWVGLLGAAAAPWLGPAAALLTTVSVIVAGRRMIRRDGANGFLRESHS
jgi:hypothetical protein